MAQVHIVFRSGGLFSAAQQVIGVYEDQLDAFTAAAKAPLLYAQTFDVIPSSQRPAPDPAAPAAPASQETTSTS